MIQCWKQCNGNLHLIMTYLWRSCSLTSVKSRSENLLMQTRPQQFKDKTEVLFNPPPPQLHLYSFTNTGLGMEDWVGNRWHGTPQSPISTKNLKFSSFTASVSISTATPVSVISWHALWELMYSANVLRETQIESQSYTYIYSTHVCHCVKKNNSLLSQPQEAGGHSSPPTPTPPCIVITVHMLLPSDLGDANWNRNLFLPWWGFDPPWLTVQRANH